MNFPFLDGDVPRSTSYGVYISQLIRFARVSSHVSTHTSNFIAGRSKTALLFWFFSGFRCGVWLFFVILVRYKNRNRK